MPKRLIVAAVALVALGCGGSDTALATVPTTATYFAMLPDGSEMSVDTVRQPDGRYEGEFFIDSASGDSPRSAGELGGTITSGAVHLSCTSLAGDQFTLDGTTTRNGELTLTKSDIGGSPVTFRQAPRSVGGRSPINFTLKLGPSADALGTATIDSVPTHSYSNGAKKYLGKWRQNVLSVFIKDGEAWIFVQLGNYTQVDGYFAGLPIEQLGVGTSNSFISQVTAYLSSGTVSMYGGTFRVSP